MYACTGRPGSIVHHRARTCYNASECAQHVADGRCRRSRKIHARNCRGRGTSCMPCQLAGLATFFFFFFFFFFDPGIHGSSKIRTDPRRIRIDPGFGGFVLPLVHSSFDTEKKTCSFPKNSGAHFLFIRSVFSVLKKMPVSTFRQL